MSSGPHHANLRAVASSVWEVARPLRDTSWWRRWRTERSCGKATGHCWHPDALIDWWCCMCSADTDGMPEQKCVRCADIARLTEAFDPKAQWLCGPCGYCNAGGICTHCGHVPSVTGSNGSAGER